MATYNINKIKAPNGDIYNIMQPDAVLQSEKGAASGVATLGTDGKIPSSQLPSYVDDVLEYSAKSQFPATGETGKIYVDTATNITYRWGGSSYVAIGSDLALGETSSTAYRGDRGKAAYDHISRTDNPHNVTAAQVGAVSLTGYVATDNNYTTTEKEKLAGIAAGAEVNQNAFSTVKVGTTNLSADTKTDTLTITAGSNITLTPTASSDSFSIAATVPTKTSDLTNDSGFITTSDIPEGAAASTTTPKMDGTATVGTELRFARGDHIHPTDTSRAAASHSHGNITNGGDITATAPTIASGDQLVINDNSASKITNGPTFDGSTTTKALTPKGTWETFATTNTDEKLKTSVARANTTYYPILDNNTSGTSTKFVSGDLRYQSTSSGETLQIGQVSSSSTKTGKLTLTSGSRYGYLTAPAYNVITANRTWTLPNATGTIALTSDIPSVTSTYSATGTTAVNGTAVARALGTLDSSITPSIDDDKAIWQDSESVLNSITITDGKITSGTYTNLTEYVANFSEVGDNIYSITSVGTVPSLTFTPNTSTANLTIGWSAGSVPTRAEKWVMTALAGSGHLSRPTGGGGSV